MLVRDQNRVQTGDIFPNRRQPFGDLAPTQARIDQDARPLGCDERRVPRAAAGEYANLNDEKSPPLRSRL
jgi:hypothetical protein